MTRHHFYWEQKYLKQGYNFVIGIDEAGRGPLAGPVVACAAAYKCHAELVSASLKRLKEIPKQVRDDKSFNKIRDSKTLSEKQRESFYDFICEHFHIGVGICDHKTIDRINILEATYLAMKKAMASLMRGISNFQIPISNKIPNPKIKNTRYQIQNTRYILLIDGNKPIPNCSYNQRAIINGDRIVKSISAASIIAKVTRDRIMREMHEIYPQYHFAEHKGYGTKLHFKMIEKHGPCPIHRASFEPVKSWTKMGKR